MEPSTPTSPAHRDSGGPYRVAQWATGTIGRRALRAIVAHPELELAALYSHSPEKHGLDAAALCGLDAPTRVEATGDIEQILTRRPDCVLYMPQNCDIDEVCAILAGGTNIVTTCGLFHHPPSMDPDIRIRVEAACAVGATSIHSTGSSPGFITEAVPLVLTSIQRRLDSLAIEEYADLSQRNSPGILFDVMGFGSPPADFAGARLDHLRDSFGPSLRLLADGIGLPLDDVTAAGEVATAEHTFEIAAGTIEKDTVAAQRITISGLRDGHTVVSFRAVWHCGTGAGTGWEIRPTGWHLSVRGDAPLEIDMVFPFPLEEMAERSPSYTANRAVNAVAHVCAAPPGIRTVLDLPAINANLGRP
ncbi:NAD(P)H-dependent amine dehydrogenase family protein [Nocardia jinanensis]|uniref:Dihydrodipicolinate reductase n=1 Tax=Nocardia jinanensis TaxID=382504 RepID=A0A917RQL1_9NOCA|nr:dihydrodipicolinate reductase [Nocardia jinanensis]GGL18641.1 dihydrodipicolinate reductase [Nocardia jinanensis]